MLSTFRCCQHSNVDKRLTYRDEWLDAFVEDGFEVPGLKLGVSGSGFRGSGPGFWVVGFEIRVSGFKLGVSSFGFRVSGFRVLGSQVWGSGSRV